MSLYEKAEQLIHGEKRDAYGPIEESYDRIAAIWSGILGINLDARHVALCMIGLKLYRESVQHKEDNIVDIYGYAIGLEKVAVPTQSFSEALDEAWNLKPPQSVIDALKGAGNAEASEVHES